jgi:hypothetical protein
MTGRWAYIVSALLGGTLAILLFPMDFIIPGNGRDWHLAGDAAQHAIAQRHFLADVWRPAVLEVGTLLGLNLAFLDGIPALALPIKAVASQLPEGFHAIGVFYVLAWVLQPVAAVWALRGAGVRSFWAAVAVAVLALSMPAFVMRFGHAALTGHFVILAALGFYFRLLKDGRWWGVAIPFQALALLVHPYLALMSLALLGAAPLTLLLRRERRFLPAALGAVAALAAMLGVMAALGYFGAAGDGGFGQYAMNLLSPAWPHRSWFLGGLVTTEVDATGHGGWEGYNWLGLGLWAALLSALLLGWRQIGLRAHAGLVLALLALAALAVSARVGLGGMILLDLGPVPGALEQFRASGRFFWSVGYALLIGAAVVLAQAGRRGLWVLGACALLQFADATPMRQALRDWAGQRAPWTVQADALRPMFRAAERVTLLPSWPCIAAEDGAARVRILELLLLASETPRPVNTMYAARWREPPRCTDAEVAATPLAPGELRIALPQAAGLLGAGSACLPLGDLTVCR